MHEDRSETRRKCAQVEAKPKWGPGQYLARGDKCTVTCPSGKSLAEPFMGYLVLKTRAPHVLALLAYPNPTGLFMDYGSMLLVRVSSHECDIQHHTIGDTDMEIPW